MEKANMPLIQVTTMQEVFTPAQKQELIARFTDVLVSQQGEWIRPATVVVIDEVSSGHFGIGGEAITIEAVRAMAAACKPPSPAPGTYQRISDHELVTVEAA